MSEEEIKNQEIEEKEQEEEKQEEKEEEETSSLYSFEVKRRNSRTGGWGKAGTIPGLKDCGEVLEREYGPGTYKLFVKDETGENVPGWNPFTITVEENTGIKTADKKNLGNYMERLQQKIQEGIEIQNLVNAQKALGQQTQEQDPDQIAYKVAEKINKDMVPPSMNDGNLKFMMWSQQQQANLIASLTKKDETPSIMVESMKAMQDQSNKFFALFIEAMKPKESKIEKILVNLLESGFIKEIMTAFRPKETAWEKIVPMLLEKTTGSVVSNMENTMRMIQEQAKSQPPIDYDKKMQSNLYFIKEIGNIATRTIKELAETIFTSKIMIPQPASATPAAAPQTQQTKENPAPAPQPEPPQQQAKNDDGKEEEAKLESIRKEFILAQKILTDNKDKPIHDIAKIFMNEVPIITYILTTHQKDEILEQIKSSIDQALLPIMSSLIDHLLLQKKG